MQKMTPQLHTTCAILSQMGKRYTHPNDARITFAEHPMAAPLCFSLASALYILPPHCYLQP